MIASLAWKSLRNRRGTAALTVASIALAVALLLAVERIREQTREAFASTVSGIDLIVGARTSPVHLLLFSVFRIGDATNNLRFETYRTIAGWPDVAWTIPLSLGDSHRGYRVVGTTNDYFDHFRFGGERRLDFVAGHRFTQQNDAVIGADVAASLRYAPGESIVLAHGSGDVAFALHSEHPFRVVGILAPTGTPVDRAIHVPLEGFDALHTETTMTSDPLASALAGKRHADEHRHGAQPHTDDAPISAFLVGLRARNSALSMQRRINEFADEALTAILPGVTLLDLWSVVGVAERALLAVSVLVVVVGLAAMLIALLTSLNERRREMAVLRSVGARPAHVFGLLVGEAALLTALGVGIGIAVFYAGLSIAKPLLASRLGLFVDIGWPSPHEWGLIMAVAIAGCTIGLVPAYRIYRYSLSDGMTIRV